MAKIYKKIAIHCANHPTGNEYCLYKWRIKREISLVRNDLNCIPYEGMFGLYFNGREDKKKFVEKWTSSIFLWFRNLVIGCRRTVTNTGWKNCVNRQLQLHLAELYRHVSTTLQRNPFPSYFPAYIVVDGATTGQITFSGHIGLHYQITGFCFVLV